MSGFVPGGTVRYSCPIGGCRWFHDVQPGRYEGVLVSAPGSLDDAIQALGRALVRQVEQAYAEHFDQDHPGLRLENIQAIAKTTPLELPAACTHDETADISRHDTAQPTVLCLDCGHTWEAEQ